MSFEKLIGDLEALQKALPKGTPSDDDANIGAAASDDNGGDDGAIGDDGEFVDGEDGASDGSQKKKNSKRSGDGDGDEDGEDMGDLTKSFSFTLETGEVVEAYDGTKMLKALGDQLAKTEARVSETHSSVEQVLAKSFEILSAQNEAIADQAALIKSLRADIVRLASQGRGRTSVVTASELNKPQETPLQKALSSTSPQEFLSKCLDAQKAGRITASETALAESYINSGFAVPESLTRRVFG